MVQDWLPRRHDPDGPRMMIRMGASRHCSCESRLTTCKGARRTPANDVTSSSALVKNKVLDCRSGKGLRLCWPITLMTIATVQDFGPYPMLLSPGGFIPMSNFFQGPTHTPPQTHAIEHLEPHKPRYCNLPRTQTPRNSVVQADPPSWNTVAYITRSCSSYHCGKVTGLLTISCLSLVSVMQVFDTLTSLHDTRTFALLVRLFQV